MKPKDDSSTRPDVSVVIPALDAERSLQRTLAAIDRQSFDGEIEVLVVDDGSSDATAELAAAHGVRVLRRKDRGGAGPARNEGAAAARADVLAFTDSDCEPSPAWLSASCSALCNADIVLGPVAPVRPTGPLERSVWIGAQSGLFEAANLVVRREIFERTGGFPAGLEGLDGAPFGEDVLFGWTAVRGGARVVFAPDALVHHEVQSRGARAFLADRRRLALFPALTKQVPELRTHFLHHRWFLNRRSARFDLALTGLLATLLARRPWPLIALVPYLGLVRHDVRTGGRRAAAVRVVADCATALALARGSIAARTVIL